MSTAVARQLRPYQHETVEFMRDNPYCLIGHEPGLGKTACTIRALDLEDVEDGIIVVAPTSALYNWQREFTIWGETTRHVCVLDKTQGKIPDADVYILAYSQLSLVSDRLIQLVKRQEWIRAVVLDEAHALKNPRSMRTKAAYTGAKNKWRASAGLPPLIKSAQYVYLLTGTPAPNHYGELYTHLNALCPDILKDKGLLSYDGFLKQFCHVVPSQFAEGQWLVRGNKNMPQLKQMLANVMFRYRKKQVLKDLPPLQFATVELDVALDAIRDQLKALDSVDLGKLDDNETLRGLDLQMSTERRLLGLAKVPAVAQYVIDELEDNQNKLILFAHHRAVLEQLLEKLAEYKPVLLYGGGNPAQRQRAIDSFQNDPTVRVFIGQITSAGTAITLTASSHVVFAEQSWTPADNYQAACRAHRIGQEDGVLAQFLVARASLDAIIGNVLARKAQAQADLFG